jgi:hypothetical protein
MTLSVKLTHNVTEAAAAAAAAAAAQLTVLETASPGQEDVHGMTLVYTIYTKSCMQSHVEKASSYTSLLGIHRPGLSPRSLYDPGQLPAHLPFINNLRRLSVAWGGGHMMMWCSMCQQWTLLLAF